MKKFDVIVVGELNIDLILNHIDSLPQVGKEILASKMDLTLGSSSAIFASNLSSLGARVAFIGKVGKDIFGDMIIRDLEAKGVDTSMVIQSKELNTGATIVLNYDEDRAMVTHPGAMENLTMQDISREQIAQAKHLHFSSYFLQPGIQGDLPKLFKMAKEAGLTTSLDTQWDPLEKWNFDFEDLLPYLDVFLPNEKELLHLTGKEDLDAAIDFIRSPKTALIIKRGNEGSVAVTNGRINHLPPFLNKEVVDAIGAGDSFNAGFIYKYINNAPVEVCQEFGNLIGAISTTAPGGTGAFTSQQHIAAIAKTKFDYNIDEFTG